MRQAAISIPNNIAEGTGRNSNPDFARFLEIAISTSSEVEYLLLLSNDLNYLELEKYIFLAKETEEIKKCCRH